MLNRIIKILFVCLFFITPFLMSSMTSELFEFNKIIFIYIITTLIASAWIFKMIQENKIIFKRTYLDFPILIFFLSQLLSTIFSIDIHTSIFGYYGRFNGGLLSLISYIILFYSFVSNCDFAFVKTILKISLISSLFVILWGLPGRFGHDLSCFVFAGVFNNSCWTDQFHPESRMFSTLGQPNWLGAYLAINFFIGLYFLLKNFYTVNVIPAKAGIYLNRFRVEPGMTLCIFYLLLNLTTILFTRSRSALGSVAIGLGILLLILLIKFRKNVRILKYILISIVILLIPIFYFKTGVSKIDNFLQIPNPKSQITNNKFQIPNPKSPITKEQSNVTESMDIRKIVWDGAIKLGFKYPIFGTGVETFAYSYYFVRPIEHNLTSEWDFLYNKAHNEYLNYLATTGFVGLGAYLLLIIVFVIRVLVSLRGSDSDRGNLNFMLLLAWFTILITNFVGFSTTTINLFFYLIPAFLILSERKDEKPLIIKDNKLTNNQKIYSITLSILTIFLLIYFVRYWLADINYAKGDNYSKISNYQEAAKYIDNALKFKYEHVYVDKLSNILANLAFIAAYQKENDLSKQLLTSADLYNKKSLSASSRNVLYWKTRAKNYYLFYQVNLDIKELSIGIDSLLEAQKLSPTDPKIPYSLSVFYSLIFDDTKDKGQKNIYMNNSISAVNTAIKLKPDYRDAYYLKGQLLKKYGKLDDAKQVFKFILNKFNPNDEEAKKEIESL